MNVAIFISGRLNSYEEKLLKLLKNSNYNIHLYLSINDIQSNFYLKALNKLSNYVIDVNFEIFEIPMSFSEKFINKDTNDRLPLPYNQLSMFYNDAKCLSMIEAYQKRNNYFYDLIMKFRSDILPFSNNFPQLKAPEENFLYSVIPPTTEQMYLLNNKKNNFVNKKIPWISDAIIYGNFLSMKKYTNTYKFCLLLNDNFNGRYPCDFEPSVTLNAYYQNLEIEYFNYNYKLSEFRHIKSSNFILKMYKKFNEKFRRKLELHRT